MEFSRQEYWSELPLPSPGDLSNLGIKPGSSALQADFSPSEPQGSYSIHFTGEETEQLGNLPQVTQLASSKAGVQARTGWLVDVLLTVWASLPDESFNGATKAQSGGKQSFPKIFPISRFKTGIGDNKQILYFDKI